MQKVIDIALAEVGYLEKKSNAQLDDKKANAGSANYTKYGRDMHAIYPEVMDFPAAWCDAFVDWCFYTAYGLANAKSLLGGNFDDYTVASAQLYKNKGAWHTSPQKGDQIFFKNSKRICHTGLVYDVDSKYVYTVEGNTSGASGVIANGGGVCKKKYALNNSKIAGYGRPNYNIVNKATLETAQKKLKQALKIEEGKATLEDAQKELKKALKIDDVGHSGNTELPTDALTTFIKGVQAATGSKVDGIAGNETISNTVTVSMNKNRKHPVVKVVQTYLNQLGFNCGTVDGIAGNKFDLAVKAYQKAHGCVADGELTARNRTWRKLLGMA